MESNGVLKAKLWSKKQLEKALMVAGGEEGVNCRRGWGRKGGNWGGKRLGEIIMRQCHYP